MERLTYNKELADVIYERLPGYVRLMDAWLAAIEGRMKLGAS